MATKYKPRIDHSKKDYESESADMGQDKKIVKKAFKMHDAQEHEGEKTDLSKLKKGGRIKKDKGTVVGRFKAGGMIDAKEITKKPNAKSPKRAADNC
jgi:fatty acid-binding protein DegV